MKEEPVAIVGAIEVLVGAIGTLFLSLDTDPKVVAASVSLALAVLGVFSIIVLRSRVTPVSKADNKSRERNRWV